MDILTKSSPSFRASYIIILTIFLLLSACGTSSDSSDDNGNTAMCQDSMDNDSDGLTDFPEDPGCSSANDDDETDPIVTTQCSDLTDNDSDGLTDFPDDPGCSSANDDDESDPIVTTQCSDLTDNDSDGLTDFPDDPGCSSANDDDESDPIVTTQCSDLTDNDSDGLTDFPDDPGCSSANDDDETDPPGWGWSISGDGKKILDGDGKNIQINGDCGYSISNVTYAEWQNYIDDRASKGVNAVWIGLIDHKFSNNSPVWDDTDSNPPFDSNVPATSYLDFSDPNPDYWAGIDDKLNYAASKGITIFAVPSYLGHGHNDAGWSLELAANGTTRCTAYGEFLGNRYKDFPNIVWMMGGDWGPVSGGSDVTDEINAIANGIKAYDKNHLMTAHPAENTSALNNYDETWLDFNTIYELSDPITDTENEYGNMPMVFIEGKFGNEAGTSDLNVMSQMYLSMLSGSIGHFTGSSETWSFSATSADSFADINADWDTTLDDYGAQYLTYVQRLQAARDLPSIEPDHSNTFVPSGDKGIPGWSYSPVRANSAQLVAFCNGGATLTVDLSQFSGTVNARWFSPENGNTQTESGSPFANTGTRDFDPPGIADDWILLIDLVSDNLGIP